MHLTRESVQSTPFQKKEAVNVAEGLRTVFEISEDHLARPRDGHPEKPLPSHLGPQTEANSFYLSNEGKLEVSGA
jgi:hypothetical protein